MIDVGIREIRRKIKLKEAMEKKAAELKLEEIQSKARVERFSLARVKEIARRHGVLIALDPETRREVDALREEFDIPKARVITDEITEEAVLTRRGKVDHNQLGLLAYQRVLFEKEETGGLLTLPEVFQRVNTGALRGKVTPGDVAKAMRRLKRDDVIAGLRELDDGVVLVSFFPVEFTPDQTAVLEVAKDRGVTTLAEVCRQLGWPEERATRALEKLQADGVARYDESYRTGRKWYFPGL